MIYDPRQLLRTVCGGLLLASLGGCMMAHVHELPPSNYTIEGVWELNPALSSDPDKVLAAVQPKPRTGPGSGKGAQGPAPEVINDPTTDLPPIDTTRGHEGQAIYLSNAMNDRYAYRPPLDFQTNALLGGQWLKIRQTEAEVSISNAATNRSFTPGERSVVSVPSGVADQVAGWSGKDFLIEVRPQIGPQVRETYTLSPDGKQLLVKIDVASEGRNRAMKVIRVYDRSTKDPALLRTTLQQALPPADE
jgi:hypothetical protein